MSCKCNWCSECSAQRKLLQADEPEERIRNRGPNHQAYPKGRKQRLDVLQQAGKTFFEYLDRREDSKARAAACSWAPSHERRGAVCCHWDRHDERWLKDAAKKYEEAMRICVDAGDVPPPSWYGKSR